MSDIIQTVTVVCGDSYMVINECDFNKKEHKKYEAPKAKKEEESKKVVKDEAGK